MPGLSFQLEVVSGMTCLLISDQAAFGVQKEKMRLLFRCFAATSIGICMAAKRIMPCMTVQVSVDL